MNLLLLLSEKMTVLCSICRNTLEIFFLVLIMALIFVAGLFFGCHTLKFVSFSLVFIDFKSFGFLKVKRKLERKRIDKKILTCLSFR